MLVVVSLARRSYFANTLLCFIVQLTQTDNKISEIIQQANELHKRISSFSIFYPLDSTRLHLTFGWIEPDFFSRFLSIWKEPVYYKQSNGQSERLHCCVYLFGQPGALIEFEKAGSPIPGSVALAQSGSTRISCDHLGP